MKLTSRFYILFFYILFLNLMFCEKCFNQSSISIEEVYGSWSAEKVLSDKSQNIWMLKNSTIIINPDTTFSFILPHEGMQGFSGNWVFKEGNLVLQSEDAPSNILLKGITKDSCVWNAIDMNSEIFFYKIKE